MTDSDNCDHENTTTKTDYEYPSARGGYSDMRTRRVTHCDDCGKCVFMGSYS